jgi:dipeptidyl aminopeptidase/acylaminoacyl peptidase
LSDKRRLEASDINLFRMPGDPQLSPDGRWVVWVLQTPVPAEDRNRTDIWLAPADGSGDGRPLAASGKDRFPRWAPDGSMVAFVSERNGKAQIWLIRPDGGEAWHLPTAQAVNSAPEWSPCGKKLAFVAKVFSQPAEWVPYPGAPAGDRERAAAEAAEQGKGGDTANRPKSYGLVATDVKVITRLNYRFDGIGYHGDRRSQVFVVDVRGPEAAAPGAAPGAGAIAEARQVTCGDFDHEQPAWTAGGLLVVAANRRPDADWRSGGDLWLVDPHAAAEAGVPANMTLLYEGDGPATAPSPSPDGGLLAFVGHADAHSRSTSPAVWVMPLAAALAAGRLPLRQADAVNLTGPADRGAGCLIASDVRYAPMLTPPRWREDSGAVYHLLTDGGRTSVVRLDAPAGLVASWGAGAALPVAGMPVRVAGEPNQVIAALDYRSGRLAFQMETPTCPSEVHTASPAGRCCAAVAPDDVVRISRANDELLAGLELARVESFRYLGADEWTIEGFTMKVPGGAPGPRPTVLFVHGGPHGVYGHSFMFLSQLVAAGGFLVLYTNPRGSQGYGQEFARAVAGDWGGRDYSDIVAGVDWLVARGEADPERLGITGWSYGGYMTSWVIGQTDRFRAAVAGAIIYNRHNFWGTSDIGHNFGTWQYGGVPWADEERVMERSPSRFVERVRTPLLLLHGEADLRCPVEQMEQMYQTLKWLGRTVVQVRYPGEYHGFQKPSHKMDRFARTRAWFERHLLE